jgi:hypothetical protein
VVRDTVTVALIVARADGKDRVPEGLLVRETEVVIETDRVCEEDTVRVANAEGLVRETVLLRVRDTEVVRLTVPVGLRVRVTLVV